MQMELFFTDEQFRIGGHPFKGVPFFIDDDFQLMDEVNDFFTQDLLLDGRINSSKTWKSYAYWIYDFLQWTNTNDIEWHQATKREIVAYRNWSIEICKLSPKTVNSRISALKRLFQFTTQNGITSTNPITEKFDSFRHNSGLLAHTNTSNLNKRNDLSIKVYNSLPKIFSDEEQIELFKIAKSVRLKLMMRILLETGMRRNEISNLTIDTVNMTINNAHKAGYGNVVMMELPSEICKGNKSREIPISYSTVMRMLQYKATTRPQLERIFEKLNGYKPKTFWLTNRGNEYKSESLTAEIANLGKQSNILAWPHKFRHTFATNFYAVTRDIRLLQKIMGHSHIETTTIYEHTGNHDRMGHLQDYQNKLNLIIPE